MIRFLRPVDVPLVGSKDLARAADRPGKLTRKNVCPLTDKKLTRRPDGREPRRTSSLHAGAFLFGAEKHLEIPELVRVIHYDRRFADC